VSYTRICLDEEELSPTIVPGASLPESPPPYSEVDPMGGQAAATARYVLQFYPL
jgi:hypothetical protein